MRCIQKWEKILPLKTERFASEVMTAFCIPTRLSNVLLIAIDTWHQHYPAQYNNTATVINGSSQEFQSCQVTQAGDMRGRATMSQCVTAMFLCEALSTIDQNFTQAMPRPCPGLELPMLDKLYLITISVPLLRIYFVVTLTEHQLLWMWHQHNYEYYLTTLNILVKILHLLLTDVLTVAQC